MDTHDFQNLRDAANEERKRVLKRQKWNLLLSGAVFLALGIGMDLAAIVFFIRGGTSAVFSVFPVMGVVFPAVGLFTAYQAKKFIRPESLVKIGIKGTASIESIVPGGTSIKVNTASLQGNMFQWTYSMRISLPGRESYLTTVSDFHASFAKSMEIGTTFPCYVDSKKPGRVLVDWEAS